MAAAPDLLVDLTRGASPELALVDADLAAALRQALELPSESIARFVPPNPEPRPADEALADDLVVEMTQLVEDVLQEATPASTMPTSDQTTTADELIVFPDDEPPRSDPVDELIVLADDERASSDAVDELIVFSDDESPRSDAVNPEAVVSPPDPVVELPTVVEREREDASGYPELPASDPGLTVQTDAALRRIREQLAVDEVAPSRRRVRRGYTVASGLIAVSALAGVVALMYAGVAPTLAVH